MFCCNDLTLFFLDLGFAILWPVCEPRIVGIRSGQEASGHPKCRMEKLENMASRLDKRREIEAAEALEGDGKAEKDGKRKRAVAGDRKSTRLNSSHRT